MKLPKKTEFIFITGGVVSSLGKGIAAASLVCGMPISPGIEISCHKSASAFQGFYQSSKSV